MSNSDTSALETKAKEFRWTEKRMIGSTSSNVSIIAEEVSEGWDISEKILGEDLRWFPPSLSDYRRLCEYADLLKFTQGY